MDNLLTLDPDGRVSEFERTARGLSFEEQPEPRACPDPTRFLPSVWVQCGFQRYRLTDAGLASLDAAAGDAE